MAGVGTSTSLNSAKKESKHLIVVDKIEMCRVIPGGVSKLNCFIMSLFSLFTSQIKKSNVRPVNPIGDAQGKLKTCPIGGATD